STLPYPSGYFEVTGLLVILVLAMMLTALSTSVKEQKALAIRAREPLMIPIYNLKKPRLNVVQKPTQPTFLPHFSQSSHLIGLS
ncbi:MAG: hypothetical protein V3S04_04510, partial [Candidatus Omnitrophota bacterium]